jgi:hypothetical protein
MVDSPRPGRQQTRRAILKKAAYAAPAVLSLAASPAFAQRGSHTQIRPVRRGWLRRLLGSDETES